MTPDRAARVIQDAWRAYLHDKKCERWAYEDQELWEMYWRSQRRW